jgi:ATP phosphoribosyltransferase
VCSSDLIKSLGDLQGKKVATELVNFTKRYLAQHGIQADIEFSWGATEAKVVNGLADAVVEVTETGSTIKAHGLKIIHELMQSHTQLIANHSAWADPWKRAKIEQVALLLQGALRGQDTVGLKMNVPDELMAEIIPLLPCLDGPTVAEIWGKPMKSVEIVVSRAQVRDLTPELRRRGVRGIIEYPLYKVI